MDTSNNRKVDHHHHHTWADSGNTLAYSWLFFNSRCPIFEVLWPADIFDSTPSTPSSPHTQFLYCCFFSCVIFQLSTSKGADKNTGSPSLPTMLCRIMQSYSRDKLYENLGSGIAMLSQLQHIKCVLTKRLQKASKSHDCHAFFLDTVDLRTSEICPRLIYSSHLDWALPQICFAVTIMSPIPVSNGMKGWAVDDLRVLAAASPALLAEDATSPDIPEMRGGNQALLPSIIALHTLA